MIFNLSCSSRHWRESTSDHADTPVGFVSRQKRSTEQHQSNGGETTNEHELCMPKYTMALVTNKQTKLAGIKPSQAKRIS